MPRPYKVSSSNSSFVIQEGQQPSVDEDNRSSFLSTHEKDSQAITRNSLPDPKSKIRQDQGETGETQDQLTNPSDNHS